MRRLIPASALAVVAALVLAIPAGAVTKAHFSVAAIHISSHHTHNAFVFTERLRRHHRVVGHDEVTCHPRKHHKLSCRAVFFFAAGKIKAKGNFGRGDNRLQVIGGTRRFDGVAGKILIHDLSASKTRLEFFLVR